MLDRYSSNFIKNYFHESQTGTRRYQDMIRKHYKLYFIDFGPASGHFEGLWVEFYMSGIMDWTGIYPSLREARANFCLLNYSWNCIWAAKDLARAFICSENCNVTEKQNNKGGIFVRPKYRGSVGWFAVRKVRWSWSVRRSLRQQSWDYGERSALAFPSLRIDSSSWSRLTRG